MLNIKLQLIIIIIIINSHGDIKQINNDGIKMC